MIAGARRTALWLSAAASLLLATGCGPGRQFQPAPQRGQGSFVKPDASTQEQPFAESNVGLPAYPKDSDLLEFKLRGLTSNRFFIDGSTLSVGPDKVVRFVLVIRTADDVRNVRFAGLRCDDRQWKDYAFGRSDRTWAVASDAQWRAIQDLTFNDYQQTLYRDYFCASGVVWSGPSGDARSLVRLLKYPPQPDPRAPR